MPLFSFFTLVRETGCNRLFLLIIGKLIWSPLGLLLCTPETVTSPLQLLRLWIHEAYRVYADRLSDDKDVELFKKAVADMVKKCFDRQSAAESSLETCCAALSEVEEAAILRMPLLFCHFARGLADAKYGPFPQLHHFQLDRLDYSISIWFDKEWILFFPKN